jgi:hypothetical protein
LQRLGEFEGMARLDASQRKRNLKIHVYLKYCRKIQTKKKKEKIVKLNFPLSFVVGLAKGRPSTAGSRISMTEDRQLDWF